MKLHYWSLPSLNRWRGWRPKMDRSGWRLMLLHHLRLVQCQLGVTGCDTGWKLCSRWRHWRRCWIICSYRNQVESTKVSEEAWISSWWARSAQVEHCCSLWRSRWKGSYVSAVWICCCKIGFSWLSSVELVWINFVWLDLLGMGCIGSHNGAIGLDESKLVDSLCSAHIWEIFTELENCEGEDLKLVWLSFFNLMDSSEKI